MYAESHLDLKPSGGLPARELRPPFAIDLLLVVATLVLVAFGLLMVYSTTAVLAQEKFGDSFYYVKRQALSAVVGLAAMVLLLRVNLEWLRKHAAYAYGGAIFLLLLPFVPGLGVSAGGANRWVEFSLFRFQPGEPAKLFFVLFMAGYFQRQEANLHSFWAGVFRPCILLIPVALLFLAEPDFGSAVVTALVVLAMGAVAGVRLKYVLYAALAFALAGTGLAIISPYRASRLVTFLAPWADASGKGYQLMQSLIAVAIGKVAGVGLGGSQQKLFFLPAAHTDFIFAVIAEELGFIGAAALIALFAVILWRGILQARRLAEDTFCFSLAVGLTLLIVLPAFLNLGVVMGLLPTKGMVLPFVGYGGSSLFSCLAAVGLLLALARHFQKRIL